VALWNPGPALLASKKSLDVPQKFNKLTQSFNDTLQKSWQTIDRKSLCAVAARAFPIQT
jgi:hypothetical protein